MNQIPIHRPVRLTHWHHPGQAPKWPMAPQDCEKFPGSQISVICLKTVPWLGYPTNPGSRHQVRPQIEQQISRLRRCIPWSPGRLPNFLVVFFANVKQRSHLRFQENFAQLDHPQNSTTWAPNFSIRKTRPVEFCEWLLYF